MAERVGSWLNGSWSKHLYAIDLGVIKQSSADAEASLTAFHVVS